MTRTFWLALSHTAALAAGFAIGIYALPILTAPETPSTVQVADAARGALFSGEFRRTLAGSDALHWGEGRVTVGRQAVTLHGRVAPGPAYKLYLVPGFVQTEEEFLRLKDASVSIGDVKTFENFIVPVPPAVDVSRYDTVVVWCEAFSQFITAAKYR